jgi:saccharopine dehydrogenase (NAD+, L-lysine forming)
MDKIRIGIIKEEKVPKDKRVPLIPRQCRELLETYPGLDIWVQPSEIRCYTDSEYVAEGITMSDNMAECDILLGVKEVPVKSLVANKQYFFFSHTIKKQAYNKKLLQAILEKRIQLIDYEVLKDNNGNRIIGFGRYAGIVGTYNGIRGYGLRTGGFDLKPAHQCHDRVEVEQELRRVKLGPVKIVVTGGGRVAGGAKEILSVLKIKQVRPEEFLNQQFDEPVFTQLNALDYNQRKDGMEASLEEFYTNPAAYESAFLPFAKQADILITCHYWNPESPALFTKEEMAQTDFKIKLIADITCDIEGSVPSTLKPSTIYDPFYGYDVRKQTYTDSFKEESITVMAVDNLPCELPRDASAGFGRDLIRQVIPCLLGDDPTKVIERATIAKDGYITQAYKYLENWVMQVDEA